MSLVAPAARRAATIELSQTFFFLFFSEKFGGRWRRAIDNQ